MKKTLVLMALAAISISACQKEKTEENVSRNIRIQAQALPVQTKAGVKDGLKPQWYAGETAALVSMSDRSVRESAALTAEDLTADGKRATFSFSGIADGNYRLISPPGHSLGGRSDIHSSCRPEPGYSGNFRKPDVPCRRGGRFRSRQHH